MKYRLRTVTITCAEPEGGYANTFLQAADIARAYLARLDADQEHMLMLGRANSGRISGIKHIASGTRCTCPVDARLLFRAALLLNATGIILVHNHPSGGAIPSADDDRLTRDMARAGLLIDIPLVDHVIVTPTAEFSYLAAGRL